MTITSTTLIAPKSRPCSSMKRLFISAVAPFDRDYVPGPGIPGTGQADLVAYTYDESAAHGYASVGLDGRSLDRYPDALMAGNRGVDEAAVFIVFCKVGSL